MTKLLTKIFENNLLKDKYPPSKSKSFRIKPSSLGSPCLRKIYYDSARVEPDFPFPLSAKKHMKLGDAIHDMLTDVFLDEGVLVKFHKPDGTFYTDNGKPDYEFRLKSEELGFKLAKIDGVYIIDGKLFLGEYKSINTNGFGTLARPKDEHLIQAVCYFHVFNKMLKEGAFSHIKELNGFEKAEGIIFLYVHKNDNEFKEFLVTDTNSMFISIVEKIIKISDFYNKKELPPKTQDWCNSCPFRMKCSKNFNNI